MNILFDIRSQTGGRTSNQDTTGALLNEAFGCFLVCDGVAGSPGGEQAAAIACNTLLSAMEERTALTPQQTVDAVSATGRAIREAQKLDAKLKQMSTTLAALFIDRHRLRAWWVHAGDSRVYLFRRGALHSVTRDHSLVQQLSDAGYENTGINSHLLYSALGAQGAHTHDCSPELALEDGDAFLLCSDGFWSNLTPDEMALALRMVNSPQEWLTLMQKTIDRGEKNDNLSAVAVWCGSPQETTLLLAPADSARFLTPRTE